MLRRLPLQNPLGSPISSQSYHRGVRHRYGVDGAVTFELWDSRGDVRFEVRVAKRDCHTRTVRWLHTVLDAIDPPLRLA